MLKTLMSGRIRHGTALSAIMVMRGGRANGGLRFANPPYKTKTPVGRVKTRHPMWRSPRAGEMLSVLAPCTYVISAGHLYTYFVLQMVRLRIGYYESDPRTHSLVDHILEWLL